MYLSTAINNKCKVASKYLMKQLLITDYFNDTVTAHQPASHWQNSSNASFHSSK